MNEIAGSHDAAWVGVAEQILWQVCHQGSDGPIESTDPRHAAAMLVLRRAIDEGIPFADTDVECQAHVDAAIVLSQLGQERHEIAANDWKIDAWEDFLRDCEPFLEATARDLLQWFVDGRGIFGRTVDGIGMWYGYLTQSEASYLANYLESLADDPEFSDSPWSGDEFYSELIAWLGTIADAGNDVWFDVG